MPVAILHTITAHIDPVPVNVARAGSVVKAILHVLVVPGLVMSTMVAVRVVRMVRRKGHPGTVARHGTA